jgi:phage terminase large subunit-like protein
VSARSQRLPRGIRIPEPHAENETLEHFERFCWTLPDPDSVDGRFKLQEFQLDPLADFFRGGSVAEFFQHLWEWPTGNGKSSLFAAIALHHSMYVVKRPRVFVIGGELEHARNTTNAGAAFILESRNRRGLLGALWEPQEYSGGRLTPLWIDNPEVGIFARSAGNRTEQKGGSSVEGKDPTLIMVEELHRHSDNGAAVGTLISKTVKAAARGQTVKVIIGTTAGTNRDSYLGRLEAMVLDEESGAVVQRDLRPGWYYTRAIDAEQETVAHIWAVPENITPPPLASKDGPALDRYLDEVKKANPATWITPKALKRVWKALGRLGRWQFIRQNADQWVTAGFGALDRGQWWSMHVDGIEIPSGPGIQVVVGLDRGYKWASTAIVPVWRPPIGKVRVAGAVIIDSLPESGLRRTSDVGDILEVMHDRWPDMVVAFDRAQGGGDVAEELEERHGITIVDHGQGVPFDIASMKLGEYVEGQKLEHDGSDKFSNQVLSAIMQPTAGGKRWRGEAPDDHTLIDGFDALAMALNVVTSPMPEKKGVQRGQRSDFRIERL